MRFHMTFPEITAWLNLGLFVIVATVIFVFKNSIRSWFEKGIQHRFDIKIEKVKSEFKAIDTELQAELSRRENEIATLQNSVLASSTGRQELFDKRRFEAAERVWSAVIKMSELKPLSATMSILNIEAISKNNTDQKIQTFLASIDNISPNIDTSKYVVTNERLFLPEDTWIDFSAFQMVLLSNYTLMKILRTAVDDPLPLLNRKVIGNLLKAALPERAVWIDSVKPEKYFDILDELEEKILMKLRLIVEGNKADHTAADRAKLLLNVTRNVDLDLSKMKQVDFILKASDLGVYSG